MAFETDEVFLLGPITEPLQAITMQWFLDNLPTGATAGDLTQIYNELNNLEQLTLKCCEMSAYNFNYLFSYLQKQNSILNEIYKCCKSIKPTKPVYPIMVGQAIEEIGVSTIDVTPKPNKSEAIYRSSVGVKEYVKKGNMVLYPVKKGYFQVLGMSNGFKVDGYQIVDYSGVDLKNYLPIYFNYMVGDLELVSINGYVVKNTSGNNMSPILIYETYNHSTKVRRTFEATNSLWFKYAR